MNREQAVALTKTPPAVEALLPRLGYFRDRWQDEKEYEPWSDYVEAVRKAVEAAGGIDVELRKPFVVRFTLDRVRYEIRVGARSVAIRGYGAAALADRG